MRPLILDISFWQDNPDTKNIVVEFDKMKLNSDGAILRIGQAEWEDTKFAEYYKNATSVDLPVGGYWYYDNRYSPEKQADKCSSILEKYSSRFRLPLFADFEDRRTEAPFHGWNNWYRFIERLKKNIPDMKIGIYTGYYYWLEFCPKDQSQRDYFGRFPLWIAQYPYDRHVEYERYSKPKIPENTWKNWLLWQVSDRGDGHFFGVESSRIDINYFNGSLNDYYRYIGFDNKEIPNEEPTPETPINIKPIEVVAVYGNEKIKYKKEI